MNETILVVEDEALVAKDLQRSLSGLGYRVPATAGSAADALACAERDRPDLVLMDVHIRGRDDGITAAAALRDRFGVPVVYLTAYGDRATVARAKGTNPYGYLVKPIKAEDLRITVELALYKHAVDRELRTRERWHGITLRSIADAVIAVDADGVVVSLNRAAEGLTGWPAMDAIGRPLDEVFRLVEPESLGPLDGPITRVRCDGEVSHGDGTLATRDGQVRLVADAVAPIVDDDGQRLGAVVVFRDVEPERRLQQQLELTRRLAALGTLAAGVGHEINNPLSYIRTNIQVVRDVLAREGDGAGAPRWIDDAAEALADADHGTEQVRRIVAELQVFTSPALAGPARSDVRRALQWAIAVVGPELRAQARLDVALAETPEVRGDGHRLGQVFVNLLTNAAQAIEPGAPERNRVGVRSRVDPAGWTVVEIDDTGCGIPDVQLGVIFDPFYSARRGGRGTGLGLAISHGIVTAMGGTIEVESQVGVGTRFRVCLPPAHDEQAAPAPAPAPAPLPPPPPTATSPAPAGPLLVVEDDAMIRDALTRLLGPPFAVVTAAGGRAALDLLDRGRRFTLILCDLAMPDINGIELYRQVGERYPDQARRMVFMTGGVASEDAAQFLQAAPLGHVDKPFDGAELIDRIGVLLATLGPPAP